MRGKIKGLYCHRKKLANGRYKNYYTLRHVGAIGPLAGDEAEDFHPMTPAFMRAYTKRSPGLRISSQARLCRN